MSNTSDLREHMEWLDERLMGREYRRVDNLLRTMDVEKHPDEILLSTLVICHRCSSLDYYSKFRGRLRRHLFATPCETESTEMLVGR